MVTFKRGKLQVMVTMLFGGKEGEGGAKNWVFCLGTRVMVLGFISTSKGR